MDADIVPFHRRSADPSAPATLNDVVDGLDRVARAVEMVSTRVARIEEGLRREHAGLPPDECGQ